jgi:RNA polymerase sigma factor (sigma-70 family)
VRSSPPRGRCRPLQVVGVRKSGETEDEPSVIPGHLMIPAQQRPRVRKNRDKRVLRHLPLVRSVANRMGPRLPQVEVDDLVSAGTIGLIEAVDRYDAELGVPFASFAYRRIKGAIIDELRRLPGTRRAAAANAISEPLSLQATIDEEQDLTLMDVTADQRASEPQRGAELSELLDAIQSLPRREREMLGLSTAGHSVSEIAQVYGCSQSLASQLIVQARFRLEERTAA